MPALAICLKVKVSGIPPALRLSWDVFNYGRITNSIRVQDARFQQLAVDYENTVLQAVQEVEDAWSLLRAPRIRLHF